MYDDSLQVIETDSANYKGYFRNGEACIELGKSHNHKNLDLLDKGLRRITKAISLVERSSELNEKQKQ